MGLRDTLLPSGWSTKGYGRKHTNSFHGLVDKVINSVLNPIQSTAMLENGALGRFVLRLATEEPKAGPGI